MSTILVATHADVMRIEPDNGFIEAGAGLDGLTPTCVTSDPWSPDLAWCGTREGGVLKTDDRGRSWTPAGLEGLHIMSISASRAASGLLWAGTEPSRVWRSADCGRSWEATAPLDGLPSSAQWAFPPRPETHHVRWIACHPQSEDRLWVAIEAGALVSTADGGATWQDRVESGPRDTHELAVHPDEPRCLRASAGDGYFESRDGGATWGQPEEGLEVHYLRSIAVDPAEPEVVVVSAASHARSAYSPRGADGRLFRREGPGSWTRVLEGWPDPPTTVAPLLVSGHTAGELWAVDERGLHQSVDGGVSWKLVARFGERPHHLRGLTVGAVQETGSRSDI